MAFHVLKTASPSKVKSGLTRTQGNSSANNSPREELYSVTARISSVAGDAGVARDFAFEATHRIRELLAQLAVTAWRSRTIRPRSRMTRPATIKTTAAQGIIPISRQTIPTTARTSPNVDRKAVDSAIDETAL
jgi:hypothetical protein